MTAFEIPNAVQRKRARRLETAHRLYQALVAQDPNRTITLCDEAGRVVARHDPLPQHDEEARSHFSGDGCFYVLSGIDPILGVCRVLDGDISAGIHALEELILQADGKGFPANAHWIRFYLSDVLLQIISRNDRVPLTTILKNLPILLKVMATGSSRITALMTCVLEAPQLDREGYFVGRAQMILGLLYKAKRKRALALQRLTEAKRIISQFGQTPTLARIDAALAELG
jgi:hypothetical protein